MAGGMGQLLRAHKTPVCFSKSPSKNQQMPVTPALGQAASSVGTITRMHISTHRHTHTERKTYN